MTVEEIVAQSERRAIGCHDAMPALILIGELNALIASWRERGKALKAREELIGRIWLGDADALAALMVSSSEEEP